MKMFPKDGQEIYKVHLAPLDAVLFLMSPLLFSMAACVVGQMIGGEVGGALGGVLVGALIGYRWSTPLSLAWQLATRSSKNNDNG